MSEIDFFLEYLEYVRSKGKAVSTINPGSDEIALGVEDALQCITLIKKLNKPILGGDILTCNSEGLTYAYQFWGSEYHYLDWYCDKFKDESYAEYKERSFHVATRAINQAAKTAMQLNQSCYIVLVI